MMKMRMVPLLLAMATTQPAHAGDAAKDRLKDLQIRVIKQEFADDKLRQDLLTFCREQVGAPLYPKAIEALRPVPSPFDKLDANAIDADDRKFLSIGGLVAYVRPHDRAIAHLAISFDGAFLATSGWDNVIHIHKLGGKEPTAWAKLEGSPSGIAFSPDSKSLASGNKETNVVVWNLTGAKPKLEHKMGGHKQRPFSVAFAPRGKMLVSGCYDPVLRIWKLDDPTPEVWAILANEKTTSLGISSLVFSHDGKLLVAGSHIGKDRLRIWDASGNFLDEKPPPAVKARLVACSPTAPILAFAGDDAEIHLWKLSPIEKLRKLPGHTGKALTPPVKALAFAPDGKLLASSGQDKRVRLWDVSSGERLREWHFNHEAAALAFSSDGRHLAVGNSDGTVYVLRLESARIQLK